ncbi:MULTISPECIES: CC_3452 family protein [Sphingopyxis]|uniref:Uncharacterized protein n=1 Tax=Sphingopyxis terrae subsp. ummariensis TaxID=429001 RepID=A0A1Y6FXJ8_9SPHN|nr:MULTISPECIES: hypothetical protein [Sphingopyxis]MBN8805323.1 hypothetical protein [Sphingopyxis terrae]ENY80923.1 hypothetical protein EBMC1_11335 [Sphingopyxis sp. MC1]PCF90512.1 hypothetical protein CPA46_14840 [Sphingopyxis terrae subsp. ummariensis]SMQ77283.1 hypothetical protein SAMN06295984_2692 [Sphingopyxis terrae subsp. ummariensis]HRE33524.1 hypothetical protein [Sphingopyxis terrae]
MFHFRLSPGTPILALAGALSIGAAALPAVPAAAAGGPFYRAELADAAKTARFVARDVVWVCEGTTCTAGRGTSRPLMMCAALAKKAGRVASFTVDGKPLEDADLARCNGEG